MKTTRITAASLSLLMLATFATPFTTADAVDDAFFIAEGKGKCGEHTDDNSKDCTFECRADDIVTVSVEADDQDEFTPARAIGSANCGGAQPYCNEERKCSDGDEADSDDSNGSCHGETDELWHDGFKYECEAIHLDPGNGVGPNQVCRLVPWACDSSALTAWVDAEVAHLQQESSRCGIAFEAAVAPDLEWVQRQAIKVQGGAEGCAGIVTADVDPATGLPATVRSQVKVSIKGDQALGRVCNAGVGCRFVLPACETNEAGLIRGCTVNGSSLAVQPSENLKALLGF